MTCFPSAASLPLPRVAFHLGPVIHLFTPSQVTRFSLHPLSLLLSVSLSPSTPCFPSSCDPPPGAGRRPAWRRSCGPHPHGSTWRSSLTGRHASQRAKRKRLLKEELLGFKFFFLNLCFLACVCELLYGPSYNNSYRIVEFKVTLCSNLPRFEVCFYRQLLLVSSSN